MILYRSHSAIQSVPQALSLVCLQGWQTKKEFSGEIAGSKSIGQACLVARSWVELLQQMLASR